MTGHDHLGGNGHVLCVHSESGLGAIRGGLDGTLDGLGRDVDGRWLRRPPGLAGLRSPQAECQAGCQEGAS
jgi:hypothetical protein